MWVSISESLSVSLWSGLSVSESPSVTLCEWVSFCELLDSSLCIQVSLCGSEESPSQKWKALLFKFLTIWRAVRLQGHGCVPWQYCLNGEYKFNPSVNLDVRSPAKVPEHVSSLRSLSGASRDFGSHARRRPEPVTKPYIVIMIFIIFVVIFPTIHTIYSPCKGAPSKSPWRHSSDRYLKNYADKSATSAAPFPKTSSCSSSWHRRA